ncbi:hypothetical protein AVEN_188822-1 [Araneus ventricosus]|uniref:Uncharacterized protein n=1 Tax=Araneus ventricosus TaxID=182803 RepID=A0A4Y2BSB2_ARAVE|nr:hypothetical protein AVEN_188822-1 [Araneus ventricosus]
MAVRNVLTSLSNFHSLSLSVIDFTPATRAFFARVDCPDVFGEKGLFLRIRTVLAVIVGFEARSEFSLSLIEELEGSRILMSLCSNGLRNQRVKSFADNDSQKWEMSNNLRPPRPL